MVPPACLAALCPEPRSFRGIFDMGRHAAWLQALARTACRAILSVMSQTDTKAAPPADPAAAGPEDPAASPESTVPTATATTTDTVTQKPGEIGGPRGPEPTRYGDWESKGRCTDF